MSNVTIRRDDASARHQARCTVCDWELPPTQDETGVSLGIVTHLVANPTHLAELGVSSTTWTQPLDLGDIYSFRPGDTVVPK